MYRTNVRIAKGGVVLGISDAVLYQMYRHTDPAQQQIADKIVASFRQQVLQELREETNAQNFMVNSRREWCVVD